jgi:hypothetical protein
MLHTYLSAVNMFRFPCVLISLAWCEGPCSCTPDCRLLEDARIKQATDSEKATDAARCSLFEFATLLEDGTGKVQLTAKGFHGGWWPAQTTTLWMATVIAEGIPLFIIYLFPVAVTVPVCHFLFPSKPAELLSFRTFWHTFLNNLNLSKSSIF